MGTGGATGCRLSVPIEGIDPFPAEGYVDPAATVQCKGWTMKILAAVSMAQLLVNAPQWQSGIDEIRRITPGPIGVGTEHELTRRSSRP